MIPPLVTNEDRISSVPPSGIRHTEAHERKRQTVVVVGHGMVGQRVCQEIRARRSLSHTKLVVFGEEPYLAYDRVHLSLVLRGGAPESISLVPEFWYEENRVTVIRQDPVTLIDRERSTVVARSGRRQPYDHLILCTGSVPVLGKIPGSDGPHVVVLRTIDDATSIRARALGAKERGLPTVIVGGGLLGIELAHELHAQGVKVEVLESADYPLSRQLTVSAGKALAASLCDAGLTVSARVRVREFEEAGEACLIHIEGKPTLRAGLVVVAVGVRPRDQLAREAGLRCDLFGGVEVKDDLLTSDPKISAIGECARHRGMTYGLVAPGYAMAEAVARRLAGADVSFGGVQVGTRLKVPGVELTVVGQSSATGLGLRELVFEKEGKYRRLALKRGRLIGITAVGTWDDLTRAQDAMARSEKLKPVQLKRFSLDEPMWKSGHLSLRTWPDAATVCTCMGVTCGALKRAAREGCENAEALSQATGAGTVCGSCRPLLSTLTDPLPEEPEGSSALMLAFSLLSAIGAVLFLCVPRIEYATSVRAEGIDVLWRTADYKQITGFSLAGLFFLSVIFSMRKRFAWFRFGDFSAWRTTHAFVGLLCLVGGFLHTGFRLGSNLDFALILVFLGSTLLGGVAGGWGFVEDRLAPDKARALRALLIRSHIYLLWPLPVLLLAHVAKVYFF